MTQLFVGLPTEEGGRRRGARTGGMEEGGARGKEGTGDGARGSRGSAVGLKAGDGPNRDVVFWSWEEGAAAVGADLGMRG